MLQNLLTAHQKKMLKREYLIRLTIVITLLITSTFLFGIVALFPLYLDLSLEMTAKEKEIALHDEYVKENNELNKKVRETSLQMHTLQENLEREKFTTLIKETLETRPEGVTVVGYSYDRVERSFVLEGVASTRDLVSPYARSIESSPRFKEVPIPIADLARNINLEFRLRGVLHESEQP